MNVTLRELIPKDAAALLCLQHRLDQETSYMMLAPGERRKVLRTVSTKERNYNFPNKNKGAPQ